jgi:gas vesicle protein
LLTDKVQPAIEKDPSLGTDAIVGTSIVAANVATSAASAALSAVGVTSSSALGATALGLTTAGSTLSAAAAAGGFGYGIGKYGINPLIELSDEKLGTGIGNTIGRTVAMLLVPFSETARNALMQDFKTQFSNLTEPAKVETKLIVGLAPGLSLISQAVKTASNIRSEVNTGNIMNGVM